VKNALRFCVTAQIYWKVQYSGEYSWILIAQPEKFSYFENHDRFSRNEKMGQRITSRSVRLAEDVGGLTRCLKGLGEGASHIIERCSSG
jgi:hypothetical protein